MKAKTIFSKKLAMLGVGALCCCLLSSCAGTGQPRLARPGDRLTVDYDCRFEDGSLAATTRQEVAEDPSVAKSPLFLPLRHYRSALLIVPEPERAGKIEHFAPFEEKIVQSLRQRAGSLELDAATEMVLDPEVPDGIPEGERFVEMAIESSRDREVSFPLAEFSRRFGAEPQVGMNFEDQGFPAEVTAMTDDRVTVRYSAKPGARVQTPYGTASVTEEGERFRIRIDARPGTPVRTGPLLGRIVSVDDENFVIDYGPPFGGEALTCRVEATPVETAVIDWHTDYDRAMASARERHQPLVIMLYADWCKWCHKMFDEVLPDPAVTAMGDDFVWLKINSDQHKEYMERFGQKGFPMFVVLDDEGKAIKTIRGFRNAQDLRRELLGLAVQSGKS